MKNTFLIIGGLAAGAAVLWYMNQNKNATKTTSGDSVGTSGSGGSGVGIIPAGDGGGVGIIPAGNGGGTPPPAPTQIVTVVPLYPAGLSEGEYVKGSTDDVYLLKNGQKLPLTGHWWAFHFGGNFSNVTQVDNLLLSYVPTGEVQN